MGLFRRRRRAPGQGPGGPATGRRYGRDGFAAEDLEHLRAFAGSRRGVEAFVEPATNVTPWTVVLVAHDGEWTRRPCEGPEAARDMARGLAIPVYDVKATGYPSRMRAWTAARRGGRQPPAAGADRTPDEQLPPDPFL